MPNMVDQTAKFSEQVENIIRIIKHGKREQILFLSAILCFSVPALVPEALKELLFQGFLKRAFSWLNVIGIVPLVWGLVRVWRKAIPRKVSVAVTAKPSAIKGPFAFAEMDGEIFSQLGREADLSKLLSWVLDAQICFAALKGESGAGKSSLLRAGLVYTLTREKEKYGVTPIYWEATPENSAAELLRTIHLACPDEKERLQNLDDLVDGVFGTRKVIIIDQAEQLLPERHPALFDLFRKIVAQKPPYTVTWLIAFREEYASTWFDFEASVPDFLPPKHSLKTFTDPQARDIIAVLAKESDLALDNAVITEMVNAMSDKGKVSPVEIGIGMMVLSELYSGPDSDIGLGRFKDAGGVTGLLRAYIKGKLEDGMPEHERSPMQNVLLDLIDPEISHQRLAQGRSSLELADKAQLPVNRIQHNLQYLASQEVRILEQLPTLAPVESGTRYRLAHERLIPAIESLAAELLAAAEQAKRLLSERYRTWAKAKRQKFLLSGKELRDVLKYYRHFAETLSPELSHYLRQSNKARHLKISFSILFVLGLLLWQPFSARVIEPWQREQRLQNFESQFKRPEKNGFAVAVKGDVFYMGDSLGEPDEQPVHPVQLTDFVIGTYEITNQQYCDFLNQDDSAKAKAKDRLDFLSSFNHIREKDGQFVVLDAEKRSDPVVTVSWFGAAAFCNFMNARNGYEPSYDVDDWSCNFAAKGFRLPTEAEWEYACRAGTTTPFNTGDNLTTDQANYNGNYPYKNYPKGEYLQETRPVGSYPPNAWGLHDMHGNVWEWCQDWYDSEYYQACQEQGVVEDPPGPETGSYRVLRGGGWTDGARYCRSASRSYDGPDGRFDGFGFRLVFVP